MLSTREQTIALVANAIAIYSINQEQNLLPKNTSMIDFVIKSLPRNIKNQISIELIDEVFEFVSTTHSS